MFAAVLLCLVAICGLAIDIGPVYNRKVDLNAMTAAAALAAARELNGTAAGVSAAKNAAKVAVERLKYMNGLAYTWDDAALSFGESPDRSGSWVSAASAVAMPQKLFYAKVDSRGLAVETGEVHPIFMPLLSDSLKTINIAHSAVAGKTTINVSPIAICAMSPDPVAERVNAGLAANELVQHGFRRGVSYDLMQLNPNGLNPVRYLINPVLAPDVYSAVFDTSLIGQFVCTGTMWVPRVTGGYMRVSPLPDASPLASLATYLNSRFDDYTGNWCSPNGAPPDYNVKRYAYDTANGAPWMSPATGRPAAATTTSRDKLETIADLPDPPSDTAAGDYGPLWAYAKAAKYASSEPSSGYATFTTADWTKLYKSGPTGPGYPSASATPYKASVGINYSAPSAAHLELSTEQRRVLNIPLLSCPVPTGTNVQARVLAVGKFFMTVPASSDKLIAEFGGLVPTQSLSGVVELYP